jgi:hypothetical protein
LDIFGLTSLNRQPPLKHFQMSIRPLPLIEVFAYLGGVAGLIATGKGAMALVKDFYEIQDKRLSIKERQLKIKQLSRELEAAKSERRIEQAPIDLRRPEADPIIRAEPLYERGRISNTALEHKRQMSHDIKMNAGYFVPMFCKNLALTVVESSDK